MKRYITVSIFSGMIFGLLDGLIYANPLARDLFMVFQPIAKTSVNAPAGIVIDLIYGFLMTGIFRVLYQSIPGKSAWIKGVNYGLFIWFFRVVMFAVTMWMMFEVPYTLLSYILITGLGEMLVMGLIFGTLVRSKSSFQ